MGGDVSFLGEVIPVEEVRSRPPFWYGIPLLVDGIPLLVDDLLCLVDGIPLLVDDLLCLVDGIPVLVDDLLCLVDGVPLLVDGIPVLDRFFLYNISTF